MDKLYANETFTIFIGRETCYYCRQFSPTLREFNTLINNDLYYYNTGGDDFETLGQEIFYNQIGIPGVPTTLYINQGTIPSAWVGGGTTAQELVDFLYQSTNQSTEESTTESTEESTNQSTEESTTESTEESANQSTEESTTESTEESTNQSTEESTTESTEESTNQSIEESTTESTEEYANQSKNTAVTARYNYSNKQTQRFLASTGATHTLDYTVVGCIIMGVVFLSLNNKKRKNIK